jgi:hypothetical protein
MQPLWIPAFGLVCIITGIVLWLLAQRHRVVDDGSWHFSMRPVWRMKKDYTRRGFSYVLAGSLLLVIGVAPSIVYYLSQL